MFFFHLGISITVFEIAAPLLHNNVFFALFLVGCFQPIAQVHKTSWFMLHYNGPTPKRHYGFSNSRQVSQIDAGKLRGWATLKKILKDSGKTHQLVDHYVDKSGKRRWKGNANLRASELGP